MKPSSSKHKLDGGEKGLRQNFFKLGISKGQTYVKPSSKDRVSTATTKKFKTNASVKTFGGSIGHSQISKVRVSSGGRVKPGASKYPEKKLKYLLHDTDKYKRKSGGGSHSRNQIYNMPPGSQTGRSYNKSNTREYSPNNVSKSPKNQVKKSRNSKRLTGSQTQGVPKRKGSKQKSSRDHEGYNTSTFKEWQKQFKTTKRGAQFQALSPKTVKNIMKSSSSGISGFEKYQMMANPSKYSEARTSNDKKMQSYLNSLASDGSKSKEDLRFVPVENISLFDDSNMPMSARNPRIGSGFSTQRSVNLAASLQNIPFVRNFRVIKIFKAWAAYCRKRKYLLKRQELAQKLPWAKPFFVPYLKSVVEPLNEIRYCSPMIEVKSKNVYNKKANGHQGFVVQ